MLVPDPTRLVEGRPADFVSHLRAKTALLGQTLDAVRGRRVQIARRWVVSFVAASYLGYEQDERVQRSACRAVRSWGVSLAIPRLLARDSLTSRLEAAIARWTGQPAALVFPSTTHVGLDALPLLAGPSSVIFVDDWAYPTSHEGMRAAQRNGARIYRFPHNDVQALGVGLHSCGEAANKVVVCDGVYSEGGHGALLTQFVRLAEVFGAAIYVDDSHGLGIWGWGPRTSGSPYGSGGGGLPRALGLPPGRIVLVGTLAKALGVPLAVLAGPLSLIERLRSVSGSFFHSNPPSIPIVAAALQALQVNETEGDQRRMRLADLVHRFQRGLRSENIHFTSNGLFPIQTVPLRDDVEAQRAGAFLRRVGVWPALQVNPPDHPKRGVLRFFITALHEASEINLAVEALATYARVNPEAQARGQSLFLRS